MKILLKLLAILVFLSSCRKNIERKKLIETLPPLNVQVTDGSGKTLIFQEPPTQNVLLTPDLAKIVVHFNATDKISAVSELCKALPEYKLKRTINAFPSLDIETLREIMPECLLVSSIYYNPEMIDVLRAQGFQVFYYDVKSLNDFYEQLEQLGILLDNPEEATAVIDTFKNTIQTYSQKTRDLNPYSVLVFTNVAELQILPEKHLLQDLLKHAGARNIISAKNKLSLEELIKKDPEFILIPKNQEQDFLDLLSSHPELHNLTAVQTKRFITYDPATYLEAKPEILVAYLELVSILHPQAQ